MKKFLMTVIFVLLLVFTGDRLGGMAMRWVNRNTKDVSSPKIRHLVEAVDEEMILLGASRCNVHYVPSILADSLDMTVYNGGVDASDNIFAHYIVLNHILSHHTPKIIVLEVMNTDFTRQIDPFKTITFFAPYIGRNQRADSVFEEAGNAWLYKMSHLYRYNSKAVSNIAGMMVDRQENEDNGYIPNPKPEVYPGVLMPDDFEMSVDSLKIKYLQKFVNLCHEKKIKLIFTIAPQYSIASDDRYEPIKELAKSNGIPIFDYHSMGLFHDKPEYFRDYKHLWDEGARAYSSIFAHDLRQYLDSAGRP